MQGSQESVMKDLEGPTQLSSPPNSEGNFSPPHPPVYRPADWGRCCGMVSLWGLQMQGQDFFHPDSHLC